MGGLNSLASMLSGGPSLPNLPPGLGLPQKANLGSRYEGTDHRNRNKQADNYNKALAELLNNQPQLDVAQRQEIYGLYSEKYPGKKLSTNVGGIGTLSLTDYSSTLSQESPAQYQARVAAAQQQQQQAAAPAPAPAPTVAAPAPAAPAPAPVPAPAPAPVQETPKPAEAAPPPTATIVTPTGNIAGNTQSTVSQAASGDAGSAGRKPGRRGRMATLLTGLGGAVESFGA